MSEVLTGDFGSLLSHPGAHVVLDLETRSSTLLVLFGGIAGGVSMPVFEFFRQTAEFPAKRRFCAILAAAGISSGSPGSAIRLLTSTRSSEPSSSGHEPNES
jgi:hypothetical protein